MSEITIDTKVQQNLSMIASKIDNETVMMDIDSGKYFGVDTVGTDIWDKIETPTTLTKVCDLLQKEYNVENDKCRESVLKLMNKMYSQGLVTILD